MKSRRTGFLVLVVALSACATPAPKPYTGTTVAHVQENVSDKADVTYLARYMLPGPKRGADVIYGAVPAPDNTGNERDAAGQVAGAAATGAAGVNPLSRSGSATAGYVGAGLGLASGLFGGGDHGPSLNGVSGAFLPAQVDGVTIQTAEQAREFVRAETRRNIETSAKRVGRQVVCVDQCDGNYPTFELRKVGGQALPYYDPPSLYVTVYIRPMVENHAQNPVFEKIVGFSPAWISAGGNGFFVCMDDQAPAGERIKESNGETIAPNRCGGPYAHPLERILLRTLTASGRYYFGWRDKAVFAWKGQVFALGDIEPQTLIKYEIAPSTDLPEGK